MYSGHAPMGGTLSHPRAPALPALWLTLCFCKATEVFFFFSEDANVPSGSFAATRAAADENHIFVCNTAEAQHLWIIQNKKFKCNHKHFGVF